MLNKKKVALFIAIPIIIIIAIIVILNLGKNGGAKIAKIYEKLSKAEAYMFEMTDPSDEKITIAKKNEATCFDMNSENEKVTTLVKDNSTYVISHSRREYTVYNADVAGETVIIDMLENIKDKEYTTGKEKINGKNYEYEEYKGFAGFMRSTNIDLEEEKSSTRFYFSGNNLAYIKTIPQEGEEELLEVKISYDVPDELFEVPSDYTEKTIY